MPEPAPSPTPPAPAVPAPAPAPPEDPAAKPDAAPPAPAVSQIDPWRARILADMGKVLVDGQIKAAEISPPAAPETVWETNTKPAAPDATPAPAPKQDAPPDPAPAPVPPEPPKKKVQVAAEQPIEDVIEGVVRRLQQDAPPIVKADAPAAPPKDPDADVVEGLTDSQREDLELARFAAAHMPDKYATHPKKLLGYYKKLDEYIQTKQREDPSWTHEKDEGYEEFVQDNRPEYSGADQRRLERAQITQEVTAQTEAKLKPRLEEAEQRTRAQELKPRIEAETVEYKKALINRMSADPASPLTPALAKVRESGFTEAGWNDAATVDPLAAQIVRQYADQATYLAGEYISLASNAKKHNVYDPNQAVDSEHNKTAQRQARLFHFIDQQENEFVRGGGAALKKEGKMFVTRAQFQKLDPAAKERHWTLGHEDVLDTLAIAAEMEAKKAFTAETQRLEKAGYVRAPKAAPPKPEDKPPAPAPAPAPSPIANVAQSPGAGEPAKAPKTGSVLSEEGLRRSWAEGAKSWV